MICQPSVTVVRSQTLTFNHGVVGSSPTALTMKSTPSLTFPRPPDKNANPSRNHSSPSVFVFRGRENLRPLPKTLPPVPNRGHFYVRLVLDRTRLPAGVAGDHDESRRIRSWIDIARNRRMTSRSGA